MMVLMIIRLINTKRVKKKLLRLRRILQRKTSQTRIKFKTKITTYYHQPRNNKMLLTLLLNKKLDKNSLICLLKGNFDFT